VDSHQEHLSAIDYIRRKSKPCVVIAASGMCSGGRIMNYLKALIEDPVTDILFIGYQAKGTRVFIPSAAILHMPIKRIY